MKEIKVEGMRCSGCENRVVNAIKALGIEQVEANHEEGVVKLECSDEQLIKAKNAIESVGFDVVE